MSSTLTELFGANATITAGVLSLTITDLKDGTDTAYLTSGITDAEKIMAALLKHSKRVSSTKNQDLTAGVVGQTSFGSVINIESRTSTTGTTETQLYEDITHRIYAPLPSNLESGVAPSDVV